VRNRPTAEVEAALAGLASPAPPTLAAALTAALDLGDRYVVVDGPAGPLHVAFSRRGIRLVELTDDEATFRAAYAARFGDRPLRPADAPPPGLLAGLEGRASSRRPTLRYDLSGLSPFVQAVLHKTAEIPRGEVRPDSWVAAEVGRPSAVRATGTALARNPVPILIPCHRVVRADGRIGHYSLGRGVKIGLLRAEGIDLDELADLAASGMRYVGSTTSAVYCLPTCASARRIASRYRVTFRSEDDAAAAGYRPCGHCRPISAVSSTT
jgi:O-6-methylguanine DNA methyltransferase